MHDYDVHVALYQNIEIHCPFLWRRANIAAKENVLNLRNTVFYPVLVEDEYHA